MSRKIILNKGCGLYAPKVTSVTSWIPKENLPQSFFREVFCGIEKSIIGWYTSEICRDVVWGRSGRLSSGSHSFAWRSAILAVYLLDTNHCIRLLQGHPALISKLRELGDAPISTCVIVRGELIFMARKSERKVENLHQVHQFLSDILIYPIDDETADIYGTLKAAILEKFDPLSI